MSKFYITTAINYTNGSPHIGHYYEAILTDFMARYRRLYIGSEGVMFQTGTDEHGIKIAKTAEIIGKTPKELCDMYSLEFKGMNAKLDVSYDYFIRTTDEDHKRQVQEIFKILLEKGDIYLGEYHGWYNVREETFVTEHEAKQSEYKDSVSGQKLVEIKEASYFFRLSKYGGRVREYILSEPSPIVPESKRIDVLMRLDKEPLHDLSISRTTFNWGIPVPNDDKHYMYVWLDALFNYYTGPKTVMKQQGKQMYWPVDCHVIGKDIIWFHGVIWPALLMAMGMELPRQIYVHNFITAEDGRKISKSLGNGVDIEGLMDKYSMNTIRYYLLRESSMENDLRFSEERMMVMHNSELADKLGNLVNRILRIVERTNEGVVPEEKAIRLFEMDVVGNRIEGMLNGCRVGEIIMVIQEIIHQINQHLNQNTVWTIGDVKYPEDKRTRETQMVLIRTYLEALYLVTCLWEPIQPSIASEIYDSLNVESPIVMNKRIGEISEWTNLVSGSSIKKGGKILYKKILKEEKDKKI